MVVIFANQLQESRDRETNCTTKVHHS